MNIVERLETLIRLLEGCRSIFTEKVEQSHQENDPPAIAFQRAFPFGANTLRSTVLLLKQRKDYLSGITLVRGFFELAMRLFWASREPSGWNRLQVYYVEQDKTYFNEIKVHEKFEKSATHCLDLATEVLARKDEHGQHYKSMPKNLDTVIVDINKRDVKEGDLLELSPG